MTKYNNLFTLEFLHGYYKDGICRDIMVQPTSETEIWMKQNGCVFKQQLNNGHFFIPDTFDLNEIIEGNKNLKLNFSCRPNNMDFINFTDFPVNKLGYYYFSNGQPDNEKLILKSEFKPSESTGNTIAQINIGLSALAENDHTNETVYKIEFQARELPWKYFILDNSGQNSGPLKLKGEKSELFVGPSQVDLQNGQKALLFDSGGNKLPLKENSGVQLNLCREAENTGNVLFDINLPNASPSSLQMSDQELSAAIYIYI